MNKNKISLLIITKNAESLLNKTLSSTISLVNEIILVDTNSIDNTLSIANKYKATIISTKEEDLGKKRNLGLIYAKNDWVLVLDADEIITKKFINEVLNELKRPKYDAYYAKFINHFLNKPLKYGGEDYKKLILFKKSAVTIKSALVHESFIPKTKNVGLLKNKVLHYSYRSIIQMLIKFHDYAIREAKQKYKNGERTSIKKIFMYPPHMFYARFIKSKGYKDGIFRIPLDLGFAYMEFITYIALGWYAMLRYK